MKVTEVSNNLKDKILSGEIGAYIPDNPNQTFREVVLEYQTKLFDWIKANEPLKPGWNVRWFEENGYIIKPDSPTGSLEELDLFRVDSQTKRAFQGLKQTPTDIVELDIEPWGCASGIKSPYNLDKLEAHHVRGLMQESPFFHGLSREESQELVRKMWESGRRKMGNTLLNRVDLTKETQHLNPYPKEVLEQLQKADPDAKGFVRDAKTGKWIEQGWTKKGGKWSNPIYKGTGIHDLLAEEGISDIKGASLMGEDVQAGFLGKSVDERFADWAEWYDLTDRKVEQLIVEAKTNPANFRGEITPKVQGTSFAEMLKLEGDYPPNQIMAMVDEVFPEISPEARLLIKNDVFGPSAARKPLIDNLLAKPTETLALSRQQHSLVNESLRQALLGKDTKRVKISEEVRQLREAGKRRFSNWGQKGVSVQNLQPNPLARALSGRGLGFAPNLDGTVSYNAGLGYQEVDALTKGIWEMGEEGRARQLEELRNLKAPMALSEGATVAGKLGRKLGTLVPVAGAAFDTIDANEKVRRAFQDPTFLNNLQATMAVGTVGTSFWNEPANLALGIGNLGIDVVRGAHSLVTDEEAREKAYNTFRALGSGSLKALGLLKY